MEIAEIREKALPIFQKYDVEKASVFGSYAKGKARGDSDVDFLLKCAPGARKSLLTHIELINDLREVLGKDVDIVTEESLSHLIRDEVLQSAKVIFQLDRQT